MKNNIKLAIFSLALAAAPLSTQAAVELITNGNFSQSYTIGTQGANIPSQLNYNGYGVTGWTSAPSNAYNFLFNPNLAGSAAYSSSGQDGTLQLYTSANGGSTNSGSANAPASLVSPVGGNFLAGSGAFQPGPIFQVVGGLSIGQQYNLQFYWAADQEAGFSGVTAESWQVTFGSDLYSTPTASTPDHGFAPWTFSTHRFTATSTSETLSFLAEGGPSGSQRPFSLLDGVSLVAAPAAVSVPDTGATVPLLGLGAAALLGLRRMVGGRSAVAFA